MTFKYRYRKQIIIGAIIVTLIGISLFGTYKLLPKTNNDKKNEKIVITKKEKMSNNKKEIVEQEEKNKIMVDVKGNVAVPGIYEFDENQRVIDAINKAGGLNEYADTSVLNLSKKLKDEMVIIVYSYDDVRNFTIVKQEESVKQQECVKGINDVENDACIEEDSNVSSSSNSKVSINSASAEELMTLEGIGESKAKAIIEYREKNGGFKALEDILNVNGIGENLFAKIKENITL